MQDQFLNILFAFKISVNKTESKPVLHVVKEMRQMILSSVWVPQANQIRTSKLSETKSNSSLPLVILLVKLELSQESSQEISKNKLRIPRKNGPGKSHRLRRKKIPNEIKSPIKVIRAQG